MKATLHVLYAKRGLRVLRAWRMLFLRAVAEPSAHGRTRLPSRRRTGGQARYNERAIEQKGALMAKSEPSIDQWLAEAKQSPNADKCGMFLAHNGIVRSTAKAQVRQGEEKSAVAQVEFSYDAAGVDAAVQEALTWPGVYYVKVWLNEGLLEVGQSIMYVLIGADIRPRCIDALQNLVGKIKNDLVIEKEIYVD